MDKKLLESVGKKLTPSANSSGEVVKYEPLSEEMGMVAVLGNIQAMVGYEELMSAGGKSLRGLMGRHRVEELKELLASYILKTEDMLGIRDREKRMSAEEVVECTNALLYAYGYHSLEEIVWVLRRIWTGQEGEIYGSLSIAKICGAFERHKMRRGAYWEGRRR